MTAMRYGNVYIAQVAMGANDTHTVKAFIEAEAHHGPSLIIAYSQCIAHGIDMAKGMHQQKLAVESGHWPLYRYNPALEREGKNPFQLDSQAIRRFRCRITSTPKAVIACCSAERSGSSAALLLEQADNKRVARTALAAIQEIGRRNRLVG